MNDNNQEKKEMTESYNQIFYKNLGDTHIIDMPVGEEDKLFYHFVSNSNANMFSTTNQMLVNWKIKKITTNELKDSNSHIYQELSKLINEISELRKAIEVSDKDQLDMFFPIIKKFKLDAQSFLVDVKAENFKLIKEIALIEKDIMDTRTKVLEYLNKITKLEVDVGIKPKAAHVQMDRILNMESNSVFDKEEKD